MIDISCQLRTLGQNAHNLHLPDCRYNLCALIAQEDSTLQKRVWDGA